MTARKKKRESSSSNTKTTDAELALKRTRLKAKKLLRNDTPADKSDRKLAASARAVVEDNAAAEAANAKAAQWLLPATAGVIEAETELERTYRVTQEDVRAAVDVSTSKKSFDLRLEELGPYSVGVDASGVHMLVIGRRGHLAVSEWRSGRTLCEVQVKETSRCGSFLHDGSYFCVAQKRRCYIYDKRGLEVHALNEFTSVRRLEFLRRHFLLCSIGDAGVLRYLDTSTGQQIANIRTKLGPCEVLCQNPANAVLCTGHHGGSVTMWAPSCSEAKPLVRILCHRGPLTGVAVDRSGTYMATTGMDSQVKIWDLRRLSGEPVHAYFSRAPARSLAISERGMLAVAYGSAVQVWKDAFGKEKQNAPYMTHRLAGKVCCL